MPHQPDISNHRWIVVADSPFLPAHGGGEQEHCGFLQAAHHNGMLALVVLPGGDRIDLTPYQEMFPGVAIVPTPRRTSPWLLLHPRKPYVVASRPAPAGLVDQVRQQAPDATGIVVFSYKSHDIGQALAQGLALPAVLRQHNREGAYHHSLAQQTSGPRGWMLRWEAQRITRDELKLNASPWLCGTADISLADATWRTGTAGHPVVHIPPFALSKKILDAHRQRVPQPDDDATAAADQHRVLFMGTLDTATNTGALSWFLDKVWPQLRRQLPTAQLDVVGRKPSNQLRQQIENTDGVSLFADVPDTAPYLQRAAVAVNPVVSGSGVNIKVVEYLAAGVAMVSTSLATAGLPLRPGVDAEIHDDPMAFADVVVALLRDDQRRAAMAAAGRAHITQLLDPDTNLTALAALLDTCHQGG